MKRALLVLSILVLVLGIGCLNYTTEANAPHHREWAHQHGFPEPSYSLYLLGVVFSSVGAGSAGFAVGRSRKAWRSDLRLAQRRHVPELSACER